MEQLASKVSLEELDRRASLDYRVLSEQLALEDPLVQQVILA